MSQDSSPRTEAARANPVMADMRQHCDNCEASDGTVAPVDSGMRLCESCRADHEAYLEMDDAADAELMPHLEAFIERCQERGLSELGILDIIREAGRTAVHNMTGSPPWKIREGARVDA